MNAVFRTAAGDLNVTGWGRRLQVLVKAPLPASAIITAGQAATLSLKLMIRDSHTGALGKPRSGSRRNKPLHL